MYILGVDGIHQNEQMFVLNEIAEYIFDLSTKNNSTQKTFDLNYDYKFYFVDFLKYGVNLNKQDIDWWEFDNILNAIFLDDRSIMNKVLEYRLYERPSKNTKVQEDKKHRFMMKMKQKYSLPNTSDSEKGLEKLWGYLEKKAGESKRMEK